MAVGSFVQQAVRTTSCQFVAADIPASLPYGHYVPRQSGYVQLVAPGGYVAQPDLYLAIFSSLMAPNGSGNAVTYTCQTGNCTFPYGDPVDTDSLPGEDLQEYNASNSAVSICSSCGDITSLVTQESLEGSFFYQLPTGLSVAFHEDLTAINITTYADMSWMSNVTTPELRQVQSFALSNMTVMGLTNSGRNATAAACALYPCVRTWVASIQNNNLYETEIDSFPIWPNLNEPYQDATGWPNWNWVESYSLYEYAGIKVPCRANGAIYTTQNVSSAPNATRLSLLQVAQDGLAYISNVSAPESCIYRHDPGFAGTLNQVFGSLFNAYCIDNHYGGKSLECSLNNNPGVQSITSWMDQLYPNGSSSFAIIDKYMASFATALTTHYRTTYGSSGGVPWPNGSLEFPVDEAQGLAWHTTVCTAVDWNWLVLPAALAGITAVLLASFIARSWHFRRLYPMWKSSIFPLLFYGDRFAYGQKPWFSEVELDELCEPKEDSIAEGRVLAVDDMRRISGTIMVEF